MKRILTFFALALLLTNCTREEVVQIIENDNLFIADAISVNNVNFTEPNFEVLVDFDPIFSDEVLLVYRRWENNTWRLLPQTIFFDDGNELDYNYDFTQTDVSIFLDSTLDLNTLGSEWTQNQNFRIVIIPAESINGVDTSDLNNVMEIFNINSF